MKRSIIGKIFALTITAAILWSCSGMTEVIAAEVELQQIAESKISDTLKSKMSQRSSDKISVALWTSDLDMNELQAETLAETTVSKAPATVRTLSQSEQEYDLEYLQDYGTDEEIQGYIEAKRAKARKAYTAMNQKFVDEQLPSGAEVTFVSQYSPLVFAEMDADDITSSAKSNKVAKVEYVDKTAKNESSSITYNSTTRADYARDHFGLKGSGVKIGIFEAGGIADRSNSQIAAMGSRYISRSGYTVVNTHATMVTVIAAGPAVGSYQGVAPLATVYATYSQYSSGNYNEIEWLISQGVNVINASVDMGGTTTTYDLTSQWIDHICASHDVHFVQAAGNLGYNGISKGAMAYNSIVVGSTDDKGTAGIDDDTLATFSSYSTNVDLPNKPDLSAPGVGIQTSAGTSSGTSYAAPQVTGTIAQICGNIPALKTQQTSVKALLIASVNYTVCSDGNRKLFNSVYSFTSYQQWGAGILDARGVRFTAVNGRYSRSTFRPTDANGTTKTYTFQATSSDNFIRVALCFMKVNIPTTSSGTNPHPGISQVGSEADVDLVVTGPNDFYQSSRSLHNNTEIVDITNPVVGTYTVKVTLYQNSNQNVPIGIAWR